MGWRFKAVKESLSMQSSKPRLSLLPSDLRRESTLMPSRLSSGKRCRTIPSVLSSSLPLRRAAPISNAVKPPKTWYGRGHRFRITLSEGPIGTRQWFSVDKGIVICRGIQSKRIQEGRQITREQKVLLRGCGPSLRHEPLDLFCRCMAEVLFNTIASGSTSFS
jgi:hypothetical protein